MTTLSNTYTSQQPAIMASLVAYLQNTANWPNGISLLTDFTPGSVVFTLLAAVSVGIDSIGQAIFMCRNAAYVITATGQDLDNKVEDYGLTRNPAVPATGTMSFAANNAAAFNISIPAGTLVSTVPTSASPAIVYATQSDATLLAGQTSVAVAVTAQLVGSASNIAAGTQLLLASMAPGIDTVTLSASITSGADAETDAALRARGLLAFQALAHGTIASYQAIVEAVPGVASAVVVPENRGPGTVDIFIEGPGNSIPSANILAEAQLAINAQCIATDNVEVLAPTQVTIAASVAIHLAAGFDPTATSALVSTAVQNFITGLGVGAGVYGFVYASHIVATALSVPGVLNATTVFTDTAVTAQQLPVAGAITVTTF